MPGHETIQGYLETVEAQIRWRRARPAVSLELRHHLEDQRDEFLQEGRGLEEAERLAVEEMGDPAAVGTALNRIHRPEISWGVLLPALLSLCLWLCLRLCSRWGVSYFADYIPRFGFLAGLALAAMMLPGLLDYTLLGRRPLALAVLITAAACVPGGIRITADYTYAVGDYLVMLLPAAMALAVYALRDRGMRGLAVCCVLGLLPTIPWVAQGRAAMMGFSLCSVLLLAAAVKGGWFGSGWRRWLMVCGLGLAVLAAMAAALAVTGCGWKWIAAAVGLETDPWYREGILWERDILSQARLAGIANGSVEMQERIRNVFRFGGYNGTMLHGFLLRFGWVGFAAAQLPVLTFLTVGWRRCRRQASLLGRLLSAAALLALTWQAAAYLLGTLTGTYHVLAELPYPFLADGGTAMVMDCALLGLLLSIFRINSIVREDTGGRAYVPRKAA